MSSLIIKIPKKLPGNFMAIALIVAGLAATASIVIAYISLQDVKNTSQDYDSKMAKITADAGLDLGLLDYNNNHDVELAANCQDPLVSCTAPVDSTASLPVRIYLDRLGCSAAEMAAKNHWYDKIVKYEKQCKGKVVNGDKYYE